MHEQEKKRQYAERVREVEHGVYTCLVFASTGGMARSVPSSSKELPILSLTRNRSLFCRSCAWLGSASQLPSYVLQSGQSEDRDHPDGQLTVALTSTVPSRTSNCEIANVCGFSNIIMYLGNATCCRFSI